MAEGLYVEGCGVVFAGRVSGGVCLFFLRVGIRPKNSTKTPPETVCGYSAGGEAGGVSVE